VHTGTNKDARTDKSKTICTTSLAHRVIKSQEERCIRKVASIGSGSGSVTVENFEYQTYTANRRLHLILRTLIFGQNPARNDADLKFWDPHSAPVWCNCKCKQALVTYSTVEVKWELLFLIFMSLLSLCTSLAVNYYKLLTGNYSR